MRAPSIPSQPDSIPALGRLTDDELLERLRSLLTRSRRLEADVVAHIAEVDQRKLYAREAAPSMFAYCTEVLHLSEPEAYLRITAARAARAHPLLLAMLADGRLHLSAIVRLAPHLTLANAEGVLARAAFKSKRQIEELVAELAPRPDAPTTMRKLPERRLPEPPLTSPEAPSSAGDPELRPDGVLPHGALPGRPTPLRPPAMVQATAPARYKVQFTASAEFRQKLDRLVALMRARVPDGDLAAILEAAVTEKLRRLETRRFGRTKSPRKPLADTNTAATGSRYIPAAVRRAADERDQGRCAFTTPDGRRCGARVHLEFHHEKPHGRGGDRSAQNIRLMCRTHNLLLAEREYGARVMTRYRGQPNASS